MESTNLRIWFASLGLATLVIATLFVIGFEIMEQHVKASIPTLAMFALVWGISIPNIIKLRQMISGQKHGLN